MNMTNDTLLSSYLKRLEAWVIAWQGRYRSDIYFQATLNITILLGALSIICLGLFWSMIHYTNERIVHTIVGNIQAIVESTPQEPQSLSTAIHSIQIESIWYVFIGVGIIAIIFGYLFARFMLWPTRETLESQKRFISNVAHELRTPLSTIKTSTEVALLDEHIQPSMRAVLDDIVRELDRISEVINNLLSLNTLTRPERIQLRNVDLGPLVDKVVARHASLARERNVEVIVKKDSYGLVLGNATALEQVITNLVKNAISYTQKNTHGTVTISLHPDYRGTVVLSIADTGIGMSQRDLEHVFEPFYRVDTSRVRNIYKSGSGLGLTIVNEIVRAHHGKIHIQSAHNQGTTVSVYLPVGSEQEEASQKKASPTKQGEISVDFSHVLPSVETKPSKKQPGA